MYMSDINYQKRSATDTSDLCIDVAKVCLILFLGVGQFKFSRLGQFLGEFFF